MCTVDRETQHKAAWGKESQEMFWLPKTESEERRQKVYLEDKGPLWTSSGVCCCGSVGGWLCVRGRCVVARCGQSVRLCCSGGHITPASPELCCSSKLKYRSNYEPTEGKSSFNLQQVPDYESLSTDTGYLFIPVACFFFMSSLIIYFQITNFFII